MRSNIAIHHYYVHCCMVTCQFLYSNTAFFHWLGSLRLCTIQVLLSFYIMHRPHVRTRAIMSGLLTMLLLSSCADAQSVENKEPHTTQYVTIVLHSLELNITTDRETVGEVLRDNHIDVYPEDLVAPDLTERTRDGLIIIIDPAVEVTIINFYGEEHHVRTRARSVGSLMAEIGYVPSDDEMIRPSVDEQIVSNMHINLIRTSEDDTEVEVTIPYHTRYVRDDTKDFTFREVTQPGKEGMKKKTIRLVYENEELVDRIIANEEIVEEPEEEIIIIGTKTPPGGTQLDTVKASYYGVGFHGRRTASGETFDKNALTAAHRTLPFGAKLKVTNTANGESVVVRINDRGPYTHGRGLDLSEAAFAQISHLGAGVVTVDLEVVNQ